MIRREARRSMDMLNAFDVFDLELTNRDYPKLTKCLDIPSSIIPFDKCIRSVVLNSWVHFYIEDYQFERIWTNPKRYVNLLSRFEGVLSPDFSVYYDMPVHMKRWNIYRNKFMSAYMNAHGLKVIPSIQIVDPGLWCDAIDGIENGSVVSVNCVGIKRRYFAKRMFNQQMKYVYEMLNPEKVILYGDDSMLCEYDNVVHFDSNHIKRIRDAQKCKVAR